MSVDVRRGFGSEGTRPRRWSEAGGRHGSSATPCPDV